MLSCPLDRNVFSDIGQICWTPVVPWSKEHIGSSVSSESADKEYMRIYPSEHPVRKKSLLAAGNSTIDEMTPRCWPVNLREGCITSAEAMNPSLRLA